MGQVALLGKNEIAQSILGSCIGLVLFHEQTRYAAFAHIVLATSEGRSGPLGKFADIAIPHMIDGLARRGASPSGLVAKIAGGSAMFGSSGPLQIGRDNCVAIETLLAQRNIPVLAEHVGGQHGRRVEFDTRSGAMKVFLAGQSEIIL
jgi:chemotaxis protein CheD